MVYRIALNFLGNSHDAEDTLQNVLLKLYTNSAEFDGDGHLRNWLIRVAVNECKNLLRNSRRRQIVALEEIGDSFIFESREQSDLFQTVMSLPSSYRTALYLFYYEDLPVMEIARLLDLTESAVTTRLSRGRQRLKLILEEK